MIREEYAEEVRKKVQERAGDGCEVIVRTVLKNNGVKLTGLTIHEDGKTVSPTLYLEGIDTEDADEAADIILNHYRKYGGKESDELSEMIKDALLDRERVLETVIPRLINYEWNCEYLEGVPHRRLMDLAVTYCLPICEGAVMKITNGYADAVGVTEEELHEAAMANIERQGYEVTRMDELLLKLKKIEIPPDGFLDPKYTFMIMTNTEHDHGAYAFFAKDDLKRIADDFGANLYLIPSSVHEILALGDFPEVTGESIAELVKAVNHDNVTPEERLSDSVYYYDRDTCEVRVAIAG